MTYSPESELSPYTERDEKAFTMLYQKYHTDMRRVAYSIAKDPIIAREAVNNVFMRLWESNTFGNIQNAQCYLRRAVRNEVLSLLTACKQQRTDVELEIIASVRSHEHSAQHVLEAEDCEKKIQFALEKLSQRQREVFVYARMYGHTHEEISQKMGISKHTVNEYIQEAQRKIGPYLTSLLD